MRKLLECVPNISEGKDQKIIKAIANEITAVSGVQLLNVDTGAAANRTVYTFIGVPKQVVEAAFRLVKKALELIDMRKHKGEHPRLGAVDVCPLIPISGITMEEVVTYAHQLGNRIGEELHISGYFYEYAATKINRKNLASCRSGEYEGFVQKLQQPDWQPDFGPLAPTEHTSTFGGIQIAARSLLIAYNVNLDTTDVTIANTIAKTIRESGYVRKDVKTGKKNRIPGTLKAVKSIGWYIRDFDIAQVSCNLIDYKITPMHILFEEVVKQAQKLGIKVTGSEVIGLLPIEVLLAAADYFLAKEKKALDVPESDKIQFAIKLLGLNDIKSFDAQKNIIEYIVK